MGGRVIIGRAAGILLMAMMVWLRTAAFSQVVPAGDRGGLNVFAGATASGFTLQYGQRKMLGFSAVVDAESTRHLGLEGEARWLVFHQTAQVNAVTWLAGPRYRWPMGRLQIYAKGLAGVGAFNFPYHDAYGRYLVVAPGGGVDYILSNRIRIRMVDGEFQYWPRFTFGAMSSFGISCGVRIRVF
jgi:hypothetical protein